MRAAWVLAACAILGCARPAPTARVQAAAAPALASPAAAQNSAPVWLARDERSRLRALLASGDDARLRAELDAFVRRDGVSRDAADRAFLRGDRAAAFHAYARPSIGIAVTATIGGWYEYAIEDLRGFRLVPRDRITAALLIGDGEAACGRFGAARAAWRQALDEDRGAGPPYAYVPEWTSALRRLFAYRRARDRSRDDVFCATPEMNAARNARFNAQMDRETHRLEQAWAQLARGDARGALRTFEISMRTWSHYGGVGTGLADAHRGIVIAAILAREDGRARAELDGIERESGGVSAADRLAIAGRWNDAFAAYRDATVREPMVGGVDRVIAAGTDAARAGDLRAAIASWSQPPDGGGAGYLHDEQVALIGIARARLGDWNGAEDAWLDATRLGRAVPEWQSLWPGNVTALQMLYRFRDRFARGEHAYRLRVDPGPRG